MRGQLRRHEGHGGVAIGGHTLDIFAAIEV